MLTAASPPRLHLRHGVSPARALEVLNERIAALDQLRRVGTGPDFVMACRDEYIMWVESTEQHLADVTPDLGVVDMLHTSRYWAIRALVPSDARPIPLIEGEIRAQRDALHRLRIDLETRIGRATSAPGHITVLDTHTLLHYQLPDSINWREVVGVDQVRLVIPLRVVEELDGKKYGGSQKLRERSRALLPRLDEMVGMGGTPGPPIRDGVTLEVLIEPGARVKSVDADEEILDTCRELSQLSGQQGGVTLVTGDTAMRMRAEAIGGIRAIAPPESCLRPSD